MSAPKSILKKPSTPYVHSHPSSKPSGAGSAKLAGEGSKLKHTVAIAQKNGAQSEKRGKGKKARVEVDDRGEDVDMSDQDEFDDEELDGDEGDDDDEAGTDEEIERSKKGKTKATPKRKRPTTAEDFGSALQSLLTESSRPTKSKPKTKTEPSLPSTEPKSESGPSTLTSTDPKAKSSKSKSTALPILSLSRAPLPPSVAENKLERRAARALKKEKEEKEDRARVRDVVEGWSHEGAGPGGEFVGALEFEKGLRKTAQRGVIKLFNAILTAHKQSAENDVEIRSTKKHKEVPITGIKGFGKKDRDNVLGRGNKEELTKEGFLELVKRGTA